MTLRIELPEELETELVSEAERRGLSLSDYALQLLQERRPTGDLPQTGADLVAYWQRESLIGSRPEITDSAAHARRLRQQAERHHGA